MAGWIGTLKIQPNDRPLLNLIFPAPPFLMKTIQYCLAGGLFLAAAFFCPTPAWADYPNFPDVQSGSDGVVQELRWPYWNGQYHNTWEIDHQKL